MPDDASEEETYKVRFISEQKRLAKLWDAYEALENDYTESNEEITRLKGKLGKTEEELDTIKQVLSKRDEEIRNQDVRLTKMKNVQSNYEPKIDRLKTTLDTEREKLKKLFEISEEMEQELDIARQGIAARDNWFMHNIDVFEKLCKSIGDRRSIIKGKFLEFGSDFGRAIPETREERPSEEEKEEGAPQPSGDRDAVVADFQKIEDLDLKKAGSLYDAGFTSVDALKRAKKYELVGVKGITPALAANIVQKVKKL